MKRSQSSRASEEGDVDVHFSEAGPWGTLACYYTFLDPPDAYFQNILTRSDTEWVFPGMERKEVEAMLRGHGIEPGDVGGEEAWVQAANGIIVRPGDGFLASITAEVRATLYPDLLRVAGDASRMFEFVIERGLYRDYTAGLDIPEEVIAFVSERVFRIGRKSLFADTAAALKRIGEPDLKTRFLKSLARARSLHVELQVEKGTDLERVARWWTAGPNRSRALPLLEAALRTRGVDSVDLMHLLPPVPRRLLNTYPTANDAFNGTLPDCYWAAMNFFNNVASTRYLDSEVPRQYYFADNFEKVDEEAEFGDVVMMVDVEADRFVHAYIYIADDIVYTKNGSGRFFPYVLMRRGDVLSRYLESEDLATHIYRLKADH